MKETCASRESNPALKLGKLQCYRYTTGACYGYVSTQKKYSRGGLNSRPSACKADVITTRLLELLREFHRRFHSYIRLCQAPKNAVTQKK